jgi:hypothetical protein
MLTSLHWALMLDTRTVIHSALVTAIYVKTSYWCMMVCKWWKYWYTILSSKCQTNTLLLEKWRQLTFVGGVVSLETLVQTGYLGHAYLRSLRFDCHCLNFDYVGWKRTPWLGVGLMDFQNVLLAQPLSVCVGQVVCSRDVQDPLTLAWPVWFY